MLRFIKEKPTTPALRFGFRKEPFERKRLDEIASKKISYGIVQAGDHVPGGMPYIKSQDLNESLRLERLERTSAEIAKKYRRSEVVPGDIVFSLRGNIGVAQIVPDSIPVSNLTQGTARISVGKDYNKYVSTAIQSQDVIRQIQAYAKGSTFREISLEDLRKITIATPSLPEQRKIADFLTAVDVRIGQLIQKKALLEDYKKGVMQQLFTQAIRFKDDHGNDFPDWEEKKLGEVVEVNPKSADLPESFIYIDLESVSDGRLHSPRRIAKSNAPSRAQRLLRKGDILYQTVRPYQMNNYRYDLDDVHVASTGYAQLRTSSHNAEFVYQSLHVPIFVGAVLDRCTGTSYPAINSKDLAEIKLGVPSIGEQTKIANFLSAIDRKIESVATQITETQTFKRGLLQQMFV